LFLIHFHIFNLPQQGISANFKSLDEWQNGSLAALDTATTMVIDIANCHSSFMVPYWSDHASPNHIYMVCAALEHMNTRPYIEVSTWAGGIKDKLQLYLDKIRHKWVAHS
jgi:hypothetical protein